MYLYPIDGRSTISGTTKPWYRLRYCQKRDPRFFNACFVRRTGTNLAYTERTHGRGGSLAGRTGSGSRGARAVARGGARWRTVARVR